VVRTLASGLFATHPWPGCFLRSGPATVFSVYAVAPIPEESAVMRPESVS